MRYLIAGAALMLAGCASLDSDLQTADGKCVQTAAMTAFVTCLNAMEEPVWQKDAPDNLPDYRAFAAARMALAQDLDNVKITAAQFGDGAAQARAKFSTVLAQNARSKQQQADFERAQNAVQDMQQRSPATGLDGAAMGGMGMGMNM